MPSRYHRIVGVARTCIIPALTILLACAGLAWADTSPTESGALVMTRDFEMQRHHQERLRTLDLSDSGDLLIRCGAMIMTVAYNQPEGLQNSQERLKLIQRQELPALNGISLKLSFTF